MGHSTHLIINFGIILQWREMLGVDHAVGDGDGRNYLGQVGQSVAVVAGIHAYRMRIADTRTTRLRAQPEVVSPDKRVVDPP